VTRWQREAARSQALLRTTQRALGLKDAAPAKEKPGKGRARRPRVRAKAVIASLSAATMASPAAVPGSEGAT
jgi:hypothetical protein